MSTTFRKFRTDNIVQTKYTAHKRYDIKLDNFLGSHEGFEDFQVIGYESLHVNAYLKDAVTGRSLRQLTVFSSEVSTPHWPTCIITVLTQQTSN